LRDLDEAVKHYNIQRIPFPSFYISMIPNRNVLIKVYPVGSKIRFLGKVLTVVAQKDNKPSCAGCYFEKHNQNKRGSSISCFTHAMACTAFLRRDKQHVIFKEFIKTE
jgi:hypothetical protein